MSGTTKDCGFVMTDAEFGLLEEVDAVVGGGIETAVLAG